jgi:hypothetical protein
VTAKKIDLTPVFPNVRLKKEMISDRKLWKIVDELDSHFRP